SLVELAAPTEPPSVDGAAEEQPPSSYLQYLPAPFHDDPFIGRFLRVFESVLSPIEQMVDALPHYFDPNLAPSQLLPWLAAWVGVELDENWPETRQRALVRSIADLYRWRGTRRGLREHLRLYAGHEPLIVESFSGMRVGQDGVLGET